MINQKNDNINALIKPGQPLKRTPLVLIVDISRSMETVREALNEAITSLLQQMKNSAMLQDTIDLLVVHFNGESKVVVDFKPIKEIEAADITIEECVGCTYTGQAIIKALDRAYEYRDKLYRKSDGLISPNQPLVFLLTDGIPDAGVGATQDEIDRVNDGYESAAKFIKAKEAEGKKGKIAFIAAGIRHPGSNITEEKLRELTSFPDRVIMFEGDKTHFDRFCNCVIEGTTIVTNTGDILEYFPDY